MDPPRSRATSTVTSPECPVRSAGADPGQSGRCGAWTLDDQPGLIRFKRNFGADERELRFLRWTPPGWREDGSGARRMLSEMTHLLTEPSVPDGVAARAGDELYRYFA